MSVTGIQTMETGQEDRNVTAGTGTWRLADGIHEIRFEEKGQSTVMQFSLEDGTCRIRKRGEVHADMLFHPEEQTRCMYHTGFGAFDLRIETRKISVRATGRRVDALLLYRLHFEGGGWQDNRVMIRAEKDG